MQTNFQVLHDALRHPAVGLRTPEEPGSRQLPLLLERHRAHRHQRHRHRILLHQVRLYVELILNLFYLIKPVSLKATNL